MKNRKDIAIAKMLEWTNVRTILTYRRLFRDYAKIYGFWQAVRHACAILWGISIKSSAVGASSVGQLAKRDVIGYVNSLLGFEHGTFDGLREIGPDSPVLQWVIPAFGQGSGGHLNIFRFIDLLEKRGVRQHIVILRPHSWSSEEAAKAKIAEWYMPLKATVGFDHPGFVPSAITLATGWQTANWVSGFRNTRVRAYFVQDFEPYFYPHSTEQVLAEGTYSLGLKGITAGQWLSDKLSAEYGMECQAFSFACDAELYKPQARLNDGKKNLIFYSRHHTPRRLFDLGVVAIARVANDIPDLNVIFVGGDVSGFALPFQHENLGSLPLDELPEVYARGDLALILSGTNLSLLPLEIAACKCPIVMNRGPNCDWLLGEEAVFYADNTVDGLQETIEFALRNTKERMRRTEAAYKIAVNSSWETEADKLHSIFQEMQA